MPGNVTQVDYQQIAELQRRMESECAEIRSLQTELGWQVDELCQSAWRGAASQQFKSEMYGVALPALRRTADAFETMGRTLAEIAQIYRLAEEEAAGLFQAQSSTDKDSQGNKFSLQNLFNGLPEIPGWVSFLFGTGISFIPVIGDGLDLIAQAFNFITGKPVDAPIAVLSAFGLVADVGWLNGPIPDPVDGANLGLAAVKSAIKLIPAGPARDAATDIIVKAAKNPAEMKRIWEVIATVGKHENVMAALAKYPQGLHLVLSNGPEAIEFMAKNGDEAGMVFRNGERFAEHVFKHADEFGSKTPKEYLELARTFTKGGGDIETVMEGADKLFYRRLTKEFAVVSPDGFIRSHYHLPLEDWLDKLKEAAKQ